MTSKKDDRPGDAAGLRLRAEEMARENAAQAPENIEALPSEETRRTLHELRVHQIELEMQNEELRRAQAELDAARARYFDLYDLAPVGYCTVSEQGLILEANLTAAGLLCVARGALVRQPITRFILKEDQDIYYLHRKRLLETGQPQERELRMVKLDGTVFWAHLATSAAEDGGGAPVCRIVISDIPERERAEVALRASEQRYRSLFGHMLDGFAYCRMLYDDQDRPVDFVYLEVNAAFEQVTGLRNLVGKRVSEVIPGIRESNPELFEIYCRVALTGKPESFEIDFKPLSRWLNISVYSPGKGYFVAVFDDISERKQNEADRETMLALLRLANASNNTQELIRTVTAELQGWSGCVAVGVRLRRGDDFPYFETRGFPAEFVQAENYLCARDANQQLLRDGQGKPVLECMCGNVLCGRFDPRLPFFTSGGSFWTNSTSRLLASTTEADRQSRTRDRCHGEGFESVALIPLTCSGRTLGLLQFNDPRPGRFTPEKIAQMERAAASLAIALEQRMTQAALRASEERYRLISENTADVIWLLNVASGQCTYVSPSVQRVFGYSPEEIMAKDVRDMLTPESYQYASSRLTEVLAAFEAGDESARTQVHQVDQLRKDGSIARAEVVTTLLPDERGRVGEILGVTPTLPSGCRRKPSSSRPSRWNRSGVWRAASLTTSTTC
jgi:PAS domain S-box-containing protein